MKIQVHNGLQSPQELEVTRVVIFDKYGNPVALAVEIESDIIIAETASNTAEFQGLLRSLGINKTLIVHDVKQRAIPEIDITDSVL
jgi:hypothetical protein